MLLSLDEINNNERTITILKQILKTNCQYRRLAKTKRPIICRKILIFEKIELMKRKSQIRPDIFQDMKLNMNAIKEKSDIAKHAEA
jgi:hypothetical protein